MTTGADAPQRWAVEHDGFTIGALDWGGHGPPLVLLHGYWSTLTMWTRNIADFSREYRVYAIDIMGQPSLSIPDRPIRNSFCA